MVAASSSSLKEYLKKYVNDDEAEKKKKKKKKKTKPDMTGVLVVDQDPVWQKPVILEEENDDSADEEKPQVDEDIEVKRMKRVEQLKARRPFGAISEDGSGWISVNDAPQKLNSNDLYSDISPPRKRRPRNDTPSPGREFNPSSTEVADPSPPRQRQKRYHSPSPEPEAKTLHSSGSDLLPSRKSRRDVPGSLGADLSPPRKSRRDVPGSSGADLSPQRKSRRDIPGPSGEDLSPPRKSKRDLSPPRKNLKETSFLTNRPKTGLVTGKDVKEEISKTKKEDWLRFKDLDPSISGRGAEPVYRDKLTGERLSKDQVLKSQKKEEKPKEVKLEWGKGLAQKREAEAKLQELELEKAKPFARSRDDPDLDSMLKDRVRWGDPMAHLLKKKQPELSLPDIGDDEQMKKSGFVVPQDIPSHSWLKRGLDAAPNRHGIRPGRHWDGVDRSNGFEKAMFTRMNEKQATEREAYLCSKPYAELKKQQTNSGCIKLLLLALKHKLIWGQSQAVGSPVYPCGNKKFFAFLLALFVLWKCKNMGYLRC